MNTQDKTVDISIVIPVYNTGEILLETIESVLCQTLQNFEIILINDGSTDKITLDILAAINNSKTRIIHQNNSGVASARNRGIKEAKGQYIAFLDHDDLYKQDKLEKLRNVMNLSDNIVLAYSGIASFGNEIPRFFNLSPVYGNKLLKFLERNWIYSTSCIMVNKSILEKYKIQFDKDCVPCDDWDFYIQCALVGDIIGISDILTLYRAHDNNQSANQIKMYLAGIKVSHKYLQQINYKLSRCDISKFKLRIALFKSLSTLYYGLALQYIFNKNFLQFFICFSKGFLYNPFSPKIFFFLWKKILRVFSR